MKAMTPREFRIAMNIWGLNQVEMAKFLGRDPRQIRRYMTGDAPPSRAETLLIRVMIDSCLSPADVERAAK